MRVGPRLHANGEEAAEESGGTKVAVACAGSFAVTLAPAPAESHAQAKKAEKKHNARMSQYKRCRPGIHPVVQRLGYLGKLRVLWEHARLYEPSKPRVVFPVAPGSYITTLHAQLQSELNADENALDAMKCVPPCVSFVLLRSRACLW